MELAVLETNHCLEDQEVYWVPLGTCVRCLLADSGGFCKNVPCLIFRDTSSRANVLLLMCFFDGILSRFGLQREARGNTPFCPAHNRGWTSSTTVFFLF